MTDVLALAEPLTPPDVVERPALARWLWERGIEYRAAGDAIGVTGAAVHGYCLPFSDPRRRTPRPRTLERLVQWTRGAITAASFTPPDGAVAS